MMSRILRGTEFQVRLVAILLAVALQPLGAHLRSPPCSVHLDGVLLGSMVDGSGADAVGLQIPEEVTVDKTRETVHQSPTASSSEVWEKYA